jgi:hypothetical protein
MRKAHAIIIGLVASLASAGQLHADPDRSLGVWQGSGTVFSKDGREAAEFTIELTRTAVDQRSTETKGNVVLTTGAVIPIFQRTTQSEGGVGFRLESNRGKGGGYCLGAGLCTSYEDAGNGQAFATTLVLDGPSKMRLLVTELDHGQAVRFIRQTLTRKP